MNRSIWKERERERKASARKAKNENLGREEKELSITDSKEGEEADIGDVTEREVKPNHANRKLSLFPFVELRGFCEGVEEASRYSSCQ